LRKTSIHFLNHHHQLWHGSHPGTQIGHRGARKQCGRTHTPHMRWREGAPLQLPAPAHGRLHCELADRIPQRLRLSGLPIGLEQLGNCSLGQCFASSRTSVCFRAVSATESGNRCGFASAATSLRSATDSAHRSSLSCCCSLWPRQLQSPPCIGRAACPTTPFSLAADLARRFPLAWIVVMRGHLLGPFDDKRFKRSCQPAKMDTNHSHSLSLFQDDFTGA
jgi:hypothetical protein